MGATHIRIPANTGRLDHRYEPWLFEARELAACRQLVLFDAAYRDRVVNHPMSNRRPRLSTRFEVVRDPEPLRRNCVFLPSATAKLQAVIVWRGASTRWRRLVKSSAPRVRRRLAPAPERGALCKHRADRWRYASENSRIGSMACDRCGAAASRPLWRVYSSYWGDER